MTIKAFFKSTGTVSLKALRALWRAIGALVAGFLWALVECLKHASAADDDSTSGASILGEASRYEADDWVARNYDLD
jgi:hypothetical protein